MENILYLEEELPEISISEYVSPDEYNIYNGKIGVNVHPEDELFDQISILIKSLKDIKITNKRKSEAFLDIHKNVIKPTHFVLSQSVIPKMFVERKLKFPDNTEDTLSFIETYNKLRKIDNYKIRYDEIRKHFFNLTSIETDGSVINPPKFTITYEPHEIQLNTLDNVRILPEDNIIGDVSLIDVYKGVNSSDINFKKLSLKDKIESKVIKVDELKTDNLDSIEKIINDFNENNWSTILDSKDDLSDLYTTWKEFIEYGIDIDNLDEKHWDELLNRLNKIKNKEKELEFLKPINYNSQPLNIEYNNIFVFYLIHKQLIEKYLPIMNTLQNDLLQLYRNFIENIPPLTLNGNLPTTIYGLAMAINDKRFDIVDIVNMIKNTILRNKLESLEKWMKSVKEWDGEKIQQIILKEIERFEKTKLSINDEKDTPLNTLRVEIDNIKRGEVLSIDDISETDILTDTIFNVTDDMIIEEDDNTDDINIQIYENDLPIDISDVDNSQKELLEIVLRMLVDLQKSSGLSLNYEEIYKMMQSNSRNSKFTLLKGLLPGYSDELLKELSTFEIENLNSVIESKVEPVNYPTVKAALEKVYKIFVDDLFNYITLFIAIWVTEIQTSVLNKTLDFKIWNGSVKCIQSWSPYGMPMEGLIDKREGVVPYILCIIDELRQSNGSLWKKYFSEKTKNTYLERLISIYETNITLKDKVVILQKEFKSSDKDHINRNLLDKANKVKQQIIDTVAQKNKKNYLNDYMNFLKNLPSVLVQSSIAKKIHIGCCLQNLNEKYRSDYDWAILVKDAYRIKKLYATQRFGTDKRPILTKVLKDEKITNPIEYVLPYSYIDYDVVKNVEVTKWYDQIREYIPINHKDITKDTIQKYINIYTKSLGKLTDKLDINIITTQLSVLELIQMYRKVIEIQYRNIQDNKYYEYKKDLLLEWNKINGLSDFILSINGFYNEIGEQNAKNIIQYCLIRQLCFPAKPEKAINDTLISDDISIPNNNMILFIRDTRKQIVEWLNNKTYNKSINYNDYINKMREQDNLEKLNIIDQMTPEERKIYVEAKKLGILELKDYLEQFKDQYDEENIEDDEENETAYYYNYLIEGENSDENNLDNFNDEY